MLIVYAAILVVLLICAGIGWVTARVRPVPATGIRPVVGPIAQCYGADQATFRSALERELGRVRGAKIATCTATSFDVNMHPSLARADDGMGLFIRIDLDGPASGPVTCTLHGQPKALLASNTIAERALAAFERELRMGLKNHEGIRLVDAAPQTVTQPPPMPAEPPGGADVGTWWR